MKALIILERWDWPFFTAGPSGFEHIEIVLQEPSTVITAKATISIVDAERFAERLSTLCRTLKAAV